MSKIVVRKVRDKSNLKVIIRNMIEENGGLKKYISKGESVLIKPNFVVPRTAKDGATTDPRILIALCEIAIEGGASKVYIGESSAQGCDTDEIFQKKGIKDELFELGVEFVNLNKEDLLEYKLRYNIGLKKIKLPKILTRVDRIWNVPKAKTHYIDKMTGAIKNYVGFIPIEERLAYHQTGLSHLVASLHKEFKSDLIVADALFIGEGEGPCLVEARKYDVLLVGDDPVAVDAVIGELFGFGYRELEFPMNAFNLDVGEIDIKKIQLVGEKLNSLEFKIKRAVIGIIGRDKPVNIIMGGACPGCLTWFKGELEGWRRNGVMNQLEEKGIQLTAMLGFNAKDERFEEHLKKGEYLVIGDCTPEKYKKDTRVNFISGCCPGLKIPKATNEFLSNNNITPEKNIF